MNCPLLSALLFFKKKGLLIMSLSITRIVHDIFVIKGFRCYEIESIVFFFFNYMWMSS